MKSLLFEVVLEYQSHERPKPVYHFEQLIAWIATNSTPELRVLQPESFLQTIFRSRLP